MRVKIRHFARSYAAVMAMPAIYSTGLHAQSQPGGSTETGTLITHRPAEVRAETTTAARVTLRDYAICTVGRARGEAVAIINLPFGTKQFDKAIRAAASPDCLGSGEFTIPPVLLRAALFEAFYMRDYGRDAKPDFTGVRSFDYTAGYSRPFSEDAQDVIGLAIVGDCAARTAPAAAQDLVTSIPGSPLEDRALRALIPILPGCVPPQQTFRFSKSRIRSGVAEALYRLSNVAHGTATTKELAR